MSPQDTLPALLPGTLGLWVGFIGSIVAVLGYFLASRQTSNSERPLSRSERREHRSSASPAVPPAALTVGRTAFLVTVAASFASAAYLMLLILTHRFDVPYVVEVSTRSLHPFYLFASFWGGQQGSFYLWLLSIGLVGLVVMGTARAYEARVMTTLSMLPGFILWLLLLKNPFQVQAEPWPDGQGISPLLENPWMTVHPPVLFLGFAATTVLFCYAVAGLWGRDFEGWTRMALPWTAFSFAVLGAGVCLGGYWAYSTLGWGGFWGWDPVENSSLFPWVGCTMLMHTLLVQRRKGVWHRTNAFLALIPFLSVLYSTFLTRSGILSDFSVHSFGSLGILWWLFGGMALFAVIGFGAFLLRWRAFPRRESGDSGYTLETAIYWAVVLLGLFGVVVIVATSWPVLSGFLSEARTRFPALSFLPARPASPEPSWYNRMTAPLGILIAVAIGTVPLVRWAASSAAEFWRKARVPLALALLAGLAALLFGVRRPVALALVVSGTWALTACILPVLRRPGDLPKLGAPLAHAGLGLLLLGIVGSSLYGTKQPLTLVQGTRQKALGYDVELLGVLPAKGTLKQEADIRFSRAGESFRATPTVHLHQALNRESQWITWPFIRKQLFHDLYVAPSGGMMTTDDLTARSGEIPSGQTIRDGAYTLRLDPQPVLLGSTEGSLETGVRISVQGPGGSETLMPTVVTNTTSFAQVAGRVASTKDGRLRLRVSGYSDVHGSGHESTIGAAAIQLSGPALGAPAVNRRVLQVEVSTKPLINFVWLGTVLMILGGLLATRYRLREAWREEACQPEAAEAPERVSASTREAVLV